MPNWRGPQIVGPPPVNRHLVSATEIEVCSFAPAAKVCFPPALQAEATLLLLGQDVSAVTVEAPYARALERLDSISPHVCG